MLLSPLQTSLTTFATAQSSTNCAHHFTVLPIVAAARFGLSIQVALPMTIALAMICFALKAMIACALQPVLTATFAVRHSKRVAAEAPLLRVVTPRVLLVIASRIGAVRHMSALVVITDQLHQTLAPVLF